ncbi:SpaA isopeptide-forming pilin-related protein [Pseudobutyrivibrio sp.]|uniref:SpaA isopeptide-forming pilin-related protein n=1 Tax=Pseudobutyrivibrio sp. TaxID=2014367 RepID=UPI001D8C13AB|nr:SpaA isopeptide-forming pilin-related protein [Pseudobutyrivibrio sp.]MBE5911497.1 LPXTG cell wall anchor domain-containing protein [Pseudobutyrivibrio sp.]
MKKMRKILSLALAVIMMMAMSITAFAADTATVTVEDLKKGAKVDIYTVATIENNKIKVKDWASQVYTVGESTTNALEKVQMSVSDVEKLEGAWNANIATAAPQQTAGDNGTVTFSQLPAGVYYIVASSDEAVYSPMVSVAITNDANGNYVATNDKVTAKGTDSDLDKEPNDTFVNAGQEVTFTITKTVPSYVNKFVVYDYTTGLSSLDGVKPVIKIDGTVLTGDYAFTKVEDDKFALVLTDLVYADDEYILDDAHKPLTIEYKATVTGTEGYENTATYSVKDDEETGEITVKGVEGDITLTKYADDETTKLDGAKFKVYKDGATTALKFVFVENKDGVSIYKLAETSDDQTKVVDEIEATKGVLKVTGLSEGKYHFDETVAPATYSINPNGVDAELKQGESLDKHVTTDAVSIYDTKLASLPFTGGMGTTIFTVLGVAIMAIAAALFFASKRKASK